MEVKGASATVSHARGTTAATTMLVKACMRGDDTEVKRLLLGGMVSAPVPILRTGAHFRHCLAPSTPAPGVESAKSITLPGP